MRATQRWYRFPVEHTRMADGGLVSLVTVYRVLGRRADGSTFHLLTYATQQEAEGLVESLEAGRQPYRHHIETEQVFLA